MKSCLFRILITRKIQCGFLTLPWILIPLSVSCLAQETRIVDLSGGMYSNASANKIPDNSASYIQNFYTDVEPIATERNGYIKRDSTILGGTKSVTGLWSFTDSSGNEHIVSFSSKTFYRNTTGGTPTAFGLKATSANQPMAAVNIGKIWFTNGVDNIWWFDGTSTGVVSAAAKGRLITPWRTRIVIANVTGALTTLYFSEDGDGTNWTLGGLPTDPFTLQIGGANDGKNIRCLQNYFDSLIVGREDDIWAVDGFDQSDVTTRQISNEVGCLEPHTVKQLDNDLIWLSNRGVDSMAGRTINFLSEPVRNVTDIIVKNSINQRNNIQTSQADWAAGTVDNAVYLDTHTAPGSVQLTFPETFASFRDGSSNTKPVWTEYESGTVTGDVSVSGGQMLLQHDGNTLGRENVYTTSPLLTFTSGVTYYVDIQQLPTDSGHLSDFYWTFRPTIAVGNPDASGIVIDFESTTTARMHIQNFSITGRSGPASTTSDFVVPSTVAFFLSSTNYQITINGSIALTGTHTETASQNYMYFGYLKGSSGSGTLILDNFQVAPQTATYTSQLLNIGSNITSWGSVSISDALTNSAALTYQFGSTTTASVSSISNYASITNGNAPSVSTNPYAGFKAIFVSSNILGTAQLSDFITTWSEGSAAPTPMATVYDRRYWLSFTTNTATSPTLDTVLVWQRTKSWTLFKGINAASFANWRDALHFGNSNDTGYVYKFDVGNNDDGSSISSSIITKSYDFDLFRNPKEFSKAYVGYLAGTSLSGSFSLAYDIDRYGTSYSLGSVNLNDNQGVTASKFWFPMSNLIRGKEVQYTITKSGTADRLRLYGFLTEYDIKEQE